MALIGFQFTCFVAVDFFDECLDPFIGLSLQSERPMSMIITKYTIYEAIKRLEETVTIIKCTILAFGPVSKA